MLMMGQPFQEVCLIGAPTDVGTSSQGTQDGPSALRQAGLVDALRALGLPVVDAGDVQGPPNPHDDERIAYRNLEAVTQWCQTLHDAVYQALSQGQMPLMVGGDHSLAMGSISAVARFCREQRKPLWVFWIDAHADFNTVDTSPTGNMHGMPLRVLCGQGASALTGLSGACPALDVAQVRQIGVRSVDPQEQVALDQTHLPVFTMQVIQAEGMEAVLTRALQDVPVDAHVHISFDIDSLDPQDAPGVGTPAEGGPTWSDIQMCLRRIAQTGRLGSMDVVELNPWRDVHAQTTLLVKTLLMDCFQAHVLACSQEAIVRTHRVDEFALINDLVARVQAESLSFDQIQQQASLHVNRLREHPPSTGMNQLMLEYALSSEEGLALMCLAEALLRIPDVPTREALIRDTLSHADWSSHLGHSGSLFVNAATWGLLLAGQLIKPPSHVRLQAATQGVLRKGGVRLVRRALEVAVGMMGAQFVMAQTIEEALKKSKTYQSKGFVFSFDMLGEAALSDAQAQAYFESYRHAILCVGGQAQHAGVQGGHGISVKLSALHPRYTELQRQRVHVELYPRLLALAQLAKQYDMGLNIDAEESERLMLSLSLFERLVFEPSLAEWEGLGLVVQSYQTRALAVVQHVARLAQWSKRRVMVRLVKGAYWDSEIKRCQQQGLSHFPVFTRKSHTDVSYLACAAELLDHADWIYPQFATHNAHTFASVIQLAKMKGVQAFEMQCLYGMGEALYQEPVERARNTHQPLRCRMYSPVGAHVSLLPYLVRRMLENGANSSFVSQIVDASVPDHQLVQNPLEQVQRALPLRTACRLPRELFGVSRVNSSGVDVYSHIEWKRWQSALQRYSKQSGCLPRVSQSVGVECAVSNAVAYLPTWQSTSKMQRAHFLLKAADLLERERETWLYLLAVEAKKTWPNAVAEVREAVDFCRYYARQLLESKGGLNEAGVAVCISPWNFPLAIFMGQVAAALASGYCVIAKPAEQTPLIGQYAVDVLHRAHVPAYALQCVQGDGAVGAQLVALSPVRAVLFTGSNAVAKHIQQALIQQAQLEGREPALLIAETGGQNAMVVDSSAHLEQVVQDVLESGFDSAGQRCSALRVLCVQAEVAPAVLNLLKAAMQELTLGPPTDASTDVGPLIDVQAHEAVLSHIQRMQQAGHVVWQGGRLSAPELPHMVQPTLIEIQHLSQLHQEVFGPVVHVLVYEHAHVDALIHQINQTGFALTFGIHSRIQSELERWVQHMRAGNVYVNRNMVGAVVGVQPFGGNGLSGTGPKAGGPLYLHHLMQASNPYFPRELDLPSPTGEQNHYRLCPRGLVWCTARTQTELLKQLEVCRTTGNTPVVQQDLDGRYMEWVRAWDAVFALAVCWVSEVDVSVLDAVLCVHHVDTLLQVHAMLAERHPAIVPVISECGSGEYPLHMLYREQVVSTNTAALGGNAALMAN